MDWANGGKGAAGGALAGASLGGPWGAAIGGALGGLGGLFGGSGMSDAEKQNQARLQALYDQIGGGREAPQGTAAQSGYSGFRTNQGQLINRLEALASGQGPSLASQQFREATDRNQAGQAAVANSGRGGPLASLTAANNMALLGSQAAQGAASSRIAEQQMALGQLGQNISAGRGADESTNQFNAGQQNQMTIQNMDARLRQMGMDDATRLSILQQLGGTATAASQRPTLGDQILAGGAGMYSMGASNYGANKAGQPKI